MSGGDDWQPGDLALGVKRGSNPLRYGVKPGHKKPVPGGVYTVEAVVLSGSGMLGLVLEGHHSGHPLAAWAARCFRKIKPLTDEEREEALREMSQPVREIVQ